MSPHYWTAEHVLEWISDHVENTKFDASTLSLAFCSMDGLSLCRMNQEEMTRTFGQQLGPHLHQSLEEYKTEHGKLKPSRLANLIKQTNVLSDGRKLTNSSTSPELQNLPGPELSEMDKLLDNFLDNLNFPLLTSLRIGHGTD